MVQIISFKEAYEVHKNKLNKLFKKFNDTYNLIYNDYDSIMFKRKFTKNNVKILFTYSKIFDKISFDLIEEIISTRNLIEGFCEDIDIKNKNIKNGIKT